LLQTAVGRQREFHADATAVQYARTVDGIGGALRKIAGLPALPRPSVPESLAHLWAAEALDPEAPVWRRWLATHPPITQRLERLYGHPVEALEAPLQPAQPDEPILAMAGWAPQIVAALQPVPAAMPRATGPVPGTDVDDGGALQRAAYWQGRGERHAALLSWLIADDAELAPWSAWREHAGNAACVEHVREDWLRLGRSARQRVFESMVARTGEAGAEDRAVLLGAARDLARSSAARLRLVRLRHALIGRARLRGHQRLEDLRPALHATSVLVAQALGPRSAAWLAALHLPAGMAESGLPWRAFALRRLHPMERPRVALAWAEAAVRSGMPNDAAAVALLADACRLLDTPLPPALEPR
jgi:hypothetical protein